MSFQLNVPPSVISRLAKETEKDGDTNGDMDSQDMAKKREDWRKLKELEEARKAGTAPAMQDEEGRDINPHIPQYIMQAPWYFGATAPTLNHQRPQDEKQKLYSSGWYKKGVKEGPVHTKFRKGACENCGAVTHVKKDCLERPRKIGARFTGSNFAPDEYNQPDLDMSYDGKRDRWNGYDPIEHKRIIEEYQQIDEAKRVLKAQRMEELVQRGEIEEVEEGGEEEDEDKYADDVDMPGQKFESKQRITVRNLRIREDTAKYLYNLDVNSSYYDPKTRAMRDNPFKNTGKEPKELPYAGDNFVRWSGDAMEMAKQQLFSWEAYEKGSEVNLQADPTKLDMLTKEYSKKKDEYKTSTKGSILEKYGGQEHLDAPPKHLLMAQTEEYVEYSRHGTILKGQEKARVKSSYEEDVYPKNHTSVWGSYWTDGQWGFICCHSFVRESYCTGAAGVDAEQTSILAEEAPPAIMQRQPSEDHSTEQLSQVPLNTAQSESESSSSSSSSEEEKRRRRKKEKKRAKKRKRKQNEKEKKRRAKKKRKQESSSSSDGSGDSSSESEDEETKRERRILQAIRKEEARLLDVDTNMRLEERKRAYNVTYDLKEPTEEDIEAFQRKRMRDDDPMAHFMK